jgi:hypothetical protein
MVVDLYRVGVYRGVELAVAVLLQGSSASRVKARCTAHVTQLGSAEVSWPDACRDPAARARAKAKLQEIVIGKWQSANNNLQYWQRRQPTQTQSPNPASLRVRVIKTQLAVS